MPKTTRKEWALFIGERRYTIPKFLKEAEKFGISRNLPPQQIKGMNYGDVVNLMQWDGKQAILFGQFIVSSVFIRNPEISKAVIEKLVDEGRGEIKDSGGGQAVERECGDYIVSGGAVVDDEKTSIGELVDLAEKYSALTEAGKGQLKMMVGGRLSHIFPKPIPLGSNGPGFSRGVLRYETGILETAPLAKSSEVVAVADYRSAAAKATKKAK